MKNKETQATSNEIANSIQSSVIIQELTFDIQDFKGRGENYSVEVYAQDPDEGDMYTVRIYDDEQEELCDFFVDSCGGSTDNMPKSDLVDFVMDILFQQKNKGIIRGF